MVVVFDLRWEGRTEEVGVEGEVLVVVALVEAVLEWPPRV